jgi:hypothetical protein
MVPVRAALVPSFGSWFMAVLASKLCVCGALQKWYHYNYFFEHSRALSFQRAVRLRRDCVHLCCRRCDCVGMRRSTTRRGGAASAGTGCAPLSGSVQCSSRRIATRNSDGWMRQT